MGRICPEGYNRFPQSIPGKLELTFAGAEANVAASLAILGHPARFVTALPVNSLADACVRQLRGLGVDTSSILRTEAGRFGLYFVEKGANQRPGNVIYDRDNSALSITAANAFDWESSFRDAGWLHLSGITPALSENAFNSALAAAETAKASGLKVSLDVNFRNKLWRWKPGVDPKTLAGRCMRQLVPHADLLFASEADATGILGIEMDEGTIDANRSVVERQPELAARLVNQFPNVEKVGITLREGVSATHNNWGAMLYNAVDGTSLFAPLDGRGNYAPYEIRDIIDRLGGGDSFAAGLLFALNTPDHAAPGDAVRFATAASCLAHSIEGDFNYSTRAEVEQLLAGDVSGRVVR